MPEEAYPYFLIILDNIINICYLLITVYHIK